MPLIRGYSQAAFEKNIATEVAAGSPLKQAQAVAFDIQRKALKAAGKTRRDIR